MDRPDLSRRDFLKAMSAAGAAATLGGCASSEPKERFGPNVALLRTPPMQTVRVGVIGTGTRGTSHVGMLLKMDGVEITAVCDTYEPVLTRAVKMIHKASGKEPAAYGAGGEFDYLSLLGRGDVDIVIIATPWEWHTRMCVDAMNLGKHAFTEVPAATTTEECWQLVHAAERNQVHCMMLENCCYGREEMFCLNIISKGLMGDVLHGEGGYLHDLRSQMFEEVHGAGTWRTYHLIRRNGNLYPTHGLGPISQYMNINRGDRFISLSSVSSPALGRAAFAKANFPPDHKWNQVEKWNCGDHNTTIVKTALGRTIIVQYDETSPRPYSRINLVRGTKGIFNGYDDRIYLEGVTDTNETWVQGASLDPLFQQYEHPLWQKLGADAVRIGGHGGMDYIMLWRIIACLRNGDPLDQSVYDAAAWSAVGTQSEISVANFSIEVPCPDFTRGTWKTTPPLGIIT